jgi:hypothetical protein
MTYGSTKDVIRETYNLMNRINQFATSAGVYLPMDKVFMRNAKVGKLSPEVEDQFKQYYKRNQYIRTKMAEGKDKFEAQRMWEDHLRRLKARRR